MSDQQPLSLLLVDDYRPSLTAIEAILAPLGHRVVFAESAAAALRLLATEEFAAILSDVRMPGMDGVKMLARLRAEGLAPLTPILLLSAERDPDAERQAYSLGAIGYLVKPFDPDLFRCRVQGAVVLYRQQRESRAQVFDVAGANGRVEGDDGAGAAAVAREAERLISRKDTFLAILGHDLRNPLAAVSARAAATDNLSSDPFDGSDEPHDR